MQDVKQYKAWFLTWHAMQEVGDALVRADVLEDYEHDWGDTYEWIEGRATRAGLRLNVWRKLGQDEYWNVEPVIVYVLYDDEEPPDSVIDDIAERVAEVFECRVYLGEVNSLANEEYEFVTTSRIDG